MPRPMSEASWRAFKRAVIAYSEVRAEFRRRLHEGTLGLELEKCFHQTLNALDMRIGHRRRADEVAISRNNAAQQRAMEMWYWCKAQ